jgi:hypothetical protein
MYKQIIALKEQNPDLKVMLAVGGWNHGSGPFTEMVATEKSRAEFVENSYNFLKKYGFDGLDLGKYKLKLYFNFNLIHFIFKIGNIQLIVAVLLMIDIDLHN